MAYARDARRPAGRKTQKAPAGDLPSVFADVYGSRWSKLYQALAHPTEHVALQNAFASGADLAKADWKEDIAVGLIEASQNGPFQHHTVLPAIFQQANKHTLVCGRCAAMSLRNKRTPNRLQTPTPGCCPGTGSTGPAYCHPCFSTPFRDRLFWTCARPLAASPSCWPICCLPRKALLLHQLLQLPQLLHTPPNSTPTQHVLHQALAPLPTTPLL